MAHHFPLVFSIGDYNTEVKQVEHDHYAFHANFKRLFCHEHLLGSLIHSVLAPDSQADCCTKAI